MENYEIIKEDIGQGSFGKVCLVKHISSGKQMVWKKINYGIMKEKERKQLINEVNILRELKHENIVRYFDKIIDKKNTTIFIIMEYCAGGDLQKLIKQCQSQNKFIPEDQIWGICMHIVMALYECHRRQDDKKILHRDLKPSNIFLDDKQNAKLGDFGFAKAMNIQSMYAHTYLGTPFYMSPEQINESEYNEKSDIWSLGCIVYEMAALHPPFQAENQLSLALKIKSGQFKRIPDRYSEELMRSIRWMLNVEPNNRPNVEDLLNLPNISMLLREKSLKKNMGAVKKKAEEVKKKQEQLKQKEEELNQREKSLLEKEREIEELERQIQEMKRLKQYSGSSTTAGTDLGNDSCMVQNNRSTDRNFFTSPSNNNNELLDSVGILNNNPSSIDMSRDDSLNANQRHHMNTNTNNTNMRGLPHNQSTKMFDTTHQINKGTGRFKNQNGQSEQVSGEFKNGNLSGLLRDSSGSQFKSLTRALNRNNSNVQSKENLVDISTNSSSDKIAFNKGLIQKQKQMQQQIMQMKNQQREGSVGNGNYRSVGNSQQLFIQTEEGDDQENTQFMLHQKNRNLHDKIAINLPRNLNGDKENISRTANQAQLNQIRTSNDSIHLKRSYENMAVNDSTVNVNPCTESQNSNSYQYMQQNTSSNNLATMSTNSQSGLPPTFPNNFNRMNSERMSQNQLTNQDQRALQKQLIKFQSKKAQQEQNINSYNSTLTQNQIRESFEKNTQNTSQQCISQQIRQQYNTNNTSNDGNINQIIDMQKQQLKKGRSSRENFNSENSQEQLSSRQVNSGKQGSTTRQQNQSQQIAQQLLQEQHISQQQFMKQQLQQQQQQKQQVQQQQQIQQAVAYQKQMMNAQMQIKNMDPNELWQMMNKQQQQQIAQQMNGSGSSQQQPQKQSKQSQQWQQQQQSKYY